MQIKVSDGNEAWYCANLELLDEENHRLKENMEAVGKAAYKRGWNDAAKKMHNFIKRHMSDWFEKHFWEDEDDY